MFIEYPVHTVELPSDRPRPFVGGRDLDNDELRLGVVDEVFYAKKREPVPGAQWTGIVTSIAVEMLRSGKVDGVVGRVRVGAKVGRSFVLIRGFE